MALSSELQLIKPLSFINASGPSDVNASFGNPLPYLQNPELQLQAHLEILSRLRKPPTYIFISSGAIYGNLSDKKGQEDGLTDPVSPYAEGKLRAENFLRMASKYYPSPIFSLRVYSAYSHALISRLPFLIASHLEQKIPLQLFGTGVEIRDFVHMDDIVEAIRVLLEDKQSEAFSVYNLGSGVGMTITFSGVKRIGDPDEMVADISKLQKMGFNPRVLPGEGLREYFKWNLQRRSR